MLIETGTAFLLLGAFVMPGFFTLIFRERVYVIRSDETPFERLLSALFYSLLIYGLVVGGALILGGDNLTVTGFGKGDRTLGQYLLVGALVFLALPGCIALTGSAWSHSKLRLWVFKKLGISDAHTVSTAWNELFRKQGACLIRVTLVDGRVVGGFYSNPSMAAYSEQGQDLYINERWELDADSWFVRKAPQTQGVWLARESIVSLEVYDIEDIPRASTES